MILDKAFATFAVQEPVFNEVSSLVHADDDDEIVFNDDVTLTSDQDGDIHNSDLLISIRYSSRLSCHSHVTTHMCVFLSSDLVRTCM